MTRLALAALAAALLSSSPAAAAAPPYAFQGAPHRADPHFTVSYSGTGTWRTDFHATPPNPGGDPDTNDAHDSSAQSWALAFDGGAALGPAQDLEGARGRTLVIGHVDHTHDDGLYPELDRVVRCTLKGGTPAGAGVPARLAIRPRRGGRQLAFTASSPLGTVLTEMPQACPDQGDSIDRILDNYFTPGFSFASSYGPDRWLTSRTVVVPARVLHRAAKVVLALRPAAAARPPLGCAVASPAYEACATHGSWSGVLTLRRQRG